MAERRLYDASEDEFIKNHYLTSTDRDIASKLGRTTKSVRNRARKIGCPRKKVVRRWSKEEDEIILASKGRRASDVAEELGRDTSELCARARKLGFKSWKRPDGGNYVDNHGYEVERFDNGVPTWVHRRVVEDIIGRPLNNREIVHHINLDKRDNRIENLHLFQDAGEHAKCHWSLYRLVGKDTSNVSEQLRVGAIIFDRNEGMYKCGN